MLKITRFLPFYIFEGPRFLKGLAGTAQNSIMLKDIRAFRNCLVAYPSRELCLCRGTTERLCLHDYPPGATFPTALHTTAAAAAVAAAAAADVAATAAAVAAAAWRNSFSRDCGFLAHGRLVRPASLVCPANPRRRRSKLFNHGLKKVSPRSLEKVAKNSSDWVEFGQFHKGGIRKTG